MKTVTYTSNKLKRKHLILGKPYKVLMEYPEGYVIINELDIPTWYGKEHFTCIDKLRLEKLDDILK
jgi:hypothetical protein